MTQAVQPAFCTEVVCQPFTSAAAWAAVEARVSAVASLAVSGAVAQACSLSVSKAGALHIS